MVRTKEVTLLRLPSSAFLPKPGIEKRRNRRRLVIGEIVEHAPMSTLAGSSVEGSASAHVPVLPSHSAEREVCISREDEPLIPTVECRICQEEDNVKNLDNPCACSGSLKFAHRDCLQRWVDEKGDLTCEICHEPYKTGYVVPPNVHPDETAIDINDGWTISGPSLAMHDPRILAMAAAQRQFHESEYDEYGDTSANGAAFIRSVALILLALLLLRHALSITNGDEDDDVSTFFSLFLLRAAGFLLPCYIMAWAITILQNRRQRQEAAAALAATEVAFILPSGQARGMQFTIAPESATTTPVTSQHELPRHEPQTRAPEP